MGSALMCWPSSIFDMSWPCADAPLADKIIPPTVEAKADVARLLTLPIMFGDGGRALGCLRDERDNSEATFSKQSNVGQSQ